MSMVINITVPIPLFVVSQVIGFIGFFIAIFGHLTKNRKKNFLLFTIANSFIAIGVAFLGNWVFFAVSLVAVFRSLAFYIIEIFRQRGAKIPKYVFAILFVVFTVATVVPTVFLAKWWVDWVLMVSKMFVLIVSMTRYVVLLKVSFVTTDAFTLANRIEFFDIIGVVQASFFILASGSFIVIAIIKHIKSKKNPPPNMPIEEVPTKPLQT